MKKTNNKSAKRKLIPAIAMLTCSAVMLSTATYAWFTMNKEVKVTGMQMKAHAEEGLLINEVAAAATGTWEEVATAGQNQAISLRPASTADLTNWWHANSKKSSSEAGAGATGVDTDNTVAIDSENGIYYSDIKFDGSTVKKETTAAETDVNAERNVFYSQATFGDAAKTAYDDGEGYYIQYKYYLKSSGNEDLKVAAGDLKANVKATLQGEGATAKDLDKALRVGVKIDDDVKIFAPITGHDTTYKVAGSNKGTTYVDMSSTNVFEANTDVAINADQVIIPKVTGDASGNGKLVEVYVWFEGEDSNCKSDNLLATLNAYQIDISFKDAGL